MTEIRFVNVAREEIAPRVFTRKKRLDLIVKAHASRYGGGEKVLVSVHPKGGILAPSNDSIYFPSVPDDAAAHEAPAFRERLYTSRRVAKGEIVLITVTPAGGGRGGGAKIGMTVAMLALFAFAAWAGPAAATGLLGLQAGTQAAGFAGKAITAGIMIGGGAVLAAVARGNQKDTKIYGVTGGGNVPRPNERIPFGYGAYWNNADLAQPDYYVFENETDTILRKRVVLGAGKYGLTEIRVGNTTFWTGNIMPNGGVVTSGITSAFPNCRFELLYGQPSTLVPASVITSPNVTGQTVPLSSDVNPILGPFVVNPVGTTVNKLQVDFSVPSGYSRNDHETTQDLHFEYAEINDAGNPISAWQTLFRTTRPLYTRKPLRWSKFKDVPAARYAVRVRNNRAKIDDNDNVDYSWDALRGYVPDTVVRDGLTEVALEVRSSKDLGVTSFADVQFRQVRHGEVYDLDEEEWVEAPIRKCVDAYVDLMRWQGGIEDDLIDIGKAVSYRGLSGFDTFDGMIRGPVSLWEAAKTILANVRAEPVRIGAGFSFVRDELHTIRRHTFSRRQIIRGSASIEYQAEADDGSAHVEVTFSDDADPKRPNGAEKYYGLPSVFGPRRIEWQGVSSYEHAMHLARWLSASGFYRRATVSFETELAGRLIQRGDPIAVDPWFVESRKVAGILSASGNTLTLDSDIVIEAGDHAMLRDADGREWGPVAVTQDPGDDEDPFNPRVIDLDADDVAAEETATGVDLADVIAPPERMPTTIIVGPLATLGEQWLVESMLPVEKGRTRITAKLDSPLVYDAIGEEITAQDPISWVLQPVEAPAVTNLRANVTQHTTSLVVQWAITAQVGAVRYEVQIAYADDVDAWETVYAGPSPVGDAPIRYLTTEEPVFVRARAFGATGLTGGWVKSDGIIAPKPIVVATDAEPGAIRWDAFDSQVQERVERAEADAQAAIQNARDIITALSSDFGRASAASARLNVDLSSRLAGLTEAVLSAQARIEDFRGVLGDLGWERIGPGGASRFRAIDTVANGLTTLSTQVSLLAGRVDFILAVSSGDFTAVESQLSVITSTLDALEGLVSTTITSLNGATGQIDDLSFRMSQAEAAIELSVTSAEFLEWTERVEAAEVAINSGTITAETIAGIRRTQEQLAEGVAGLIARMQSLTDTAFEAAAQTRLELTSSVSDLGEAQARFALELYAVQSNAAAQLLDRATVLANATSAVASRVTALETAVNHPSTGLSATSTALGAVTTRVDAAEGGITALGLRATALETSVNDPTTGLATKASITSVETVQSQVDAQGSTLSSQATTLSGLSSSLSTTNTNVAAAQAAADAAAALAGSKGKVIVQSADPDVADRLPQNLWIDLTGSANAPKRWNGSAWVVVSDKVATDAAAAAASALAGLADAEADIATLQSTKVDAAGATAIAQTVLDATFGAGSANVKWRLAALATPTGYDALFEVQASVTGADGTFKASGMRIAVLTVASVQVAQIEFVADRLLVRRPSDNAVVLGWDSAESVLSIFNGVFEAGQVRSTTGRTLLDLDNDALIFKDASNNEIMRVGYHP